MNRLSVGTTKEAEKHRMTLFGLLKVPGNERCADCDEVNPEWASINLGIFVCVNCSGIHRNLGVHISQVRSLILDTWEEEQVAFMAANGNAKVNAVLENCLPPGSIFCFPYSYLEVIFVSSRCVEAITKRSIGY